MAQPKLGSGERHRRLSAQLKKRGARNPDALSAWIGRRKFGKARFQQLAARGRKRG
jgi:hypothetical protein